MAPQIIFGCATFAMDKTDFQDRTSVASVLRTLKDSGVRRLDTAPRYPPFIPGRSEELIGECPRENSDFLIDTKIFIDTSKDGNGELTAEAIDRSTKESLSRLGKPSDGFNVLYIHRADFVTPVAEQVRAFNEQIKLGRCRAWGISNVPIEMCEEIFKICEDEGLQKPVCYQGEYSVMTRGAEAGLLKMLRAHGVSFNAFRSIAAGFLTGNMIKNNHAGTRFADDNPLGKYCQNKFGSEVLHRAMEQFNATVVSHGMTTIEVAIRWVFYHSALTDKDGVILGASKEQQVKELVTMIEHGPLPVELLGSTQELWNAVQESRGSIF